MQSCRGIDQSAVKSSSREEPITYNEIGAWWAALGGLYRDLSEDTANGTVRRALELGRATFNYLPASTETLEKVRRIEDICRDYSVPLKAAALQFPLAHPAVASIIPGARTGAEVEENFRLVGHPIPAESWTDLRRQKLRPEEAPVPIETNTRDPRLP